MESKAGAEFEASTEKLLADLRAVVHDGEELLRVGMRGLSERGMAARDRLGAALQMAKETQRKLQRQVSSSAAATDRAIRRNPYPSVGIAFGIGVLIGILAKRR